jgi:hypothetical protein
LLEEIQTSATFCEDRANSKSYPATFRVVSASFSSAKKVDLTWRSITLESPGQPPSTYGLKPHRQNDRNSSFTTKHAVYSVMRGLGEPITVRLSVYNSADNKWNELEQRDLTSEPGPLAPLGLPLLHRSQSAVTKVLSWPQGMHLKLEFSGLPEVPSLIWDAVERKKE